MAAKNQFSFWYDDNNNDIVLQFVIPATKTDVRMRVTAVEENPFAIIKDFKSLIIDALKKRIQSCTSQLMAHIADIKETTDVEIMYETKHGLKHFCYPSYVAMNNAIAKLQNGDEELLNLMEIKQIQKALYWAELKDTENFSAGQLISALELVEVVRTEEPCDAPFEE